MRLNKFVSALSVALAVSAFACGDDDDDVSDIDAGDDGGDIDAGDDGIGEPSFDDPEGGIVLVEYIQFGDTLAEVFGLPEGETTVFRAIADFKNSGNSFEMPSFDGCTTLIAEDADDNHWPMGFDEDSEALDVGDVTLVGVNADDDEVENELPLVEPEGDDETVTDNIGRVHHRFYQDIQPGADDFLTDDTFITVETSGSDDAEPATYTDKVYVGPVMPLMDPGLNDEVTLTAGEDLEVSWENLEADNEDTGYFQATWLASASTGAPIAICLGGTESQVIDGDTIQDYIDIVDAQGGDTTKALLLRQNVRHKLEWLQNGTADDEGQVDPDNKRRLDILGVWCNVQLVDVAEAE